MERVKIKLIYFRMALPLVVSLAAVLLSAACSKGNTNPVMETVNSAATNNDTSMPITGTKKYIALGDSYTIGTSVGETDRYPLQTAALLKAEGITASVDIIATNGWTTADLINATKNNPAGNDFDIVTLLIGVNNQYQGRTLDEYKAQFTTLVQRSIQMANGKANHVIVLSIPDYSVTPFAKGRNTEQIATEIDAFNAANKIIADTYKVHYLNVTEDSRKAAADLSLVASDGLHFSGKEYAVWSLKLAPVIKAALQ